MQHSRDANTLAILMHPSLSPLHGLLALVPLGGTTTNPQRCHNGRRVNRKQT